MWPGELFQRLGIEAVAAQQRDPARAMLDAVLRVAQADGSATSGDHHIVQRKAAQRAKQQHRRHLARSGYNVAALRRSPSARSAITPGSPSNTSTIAAAICPSTSPERMSRSSECLVARTRSRRCDASRPELPCGRATASCGPDPLAVGGKQPHRPASRADDRGVVRQPRVDPAGDLFDGVGDVKRCRSEGRSPRRSPRRSATPLHSRRCFEQPAASASFGIADDRDAATRPVGRRGRHCVLPVFDGDGQRGSRRRDRRSRLPARSIDAPPAWGHSGSRATAVGHPREAPRPMDSPDRRSPRRRYSPTTPR